MTLALGPPHFSFAITCASKSAFLDRWSAAYRDEKRDAEFYIPFIGANLRQDWNALRSLYVWKNGQELSGAKEASVRHHYFDRWDETPDLASRFLNKLHPGGAFWNMFYLHIRQPAVWPHFDQNSYRAMRFIQTGELLGDVLRDGPEATYAAYRDEYIPFVGELGADHRKIDRALSSFGQFLKLAEPFCPQ